MKCSLGFRVLNTAPRDHITKGVMTSAAMKLRKAMISRTGSSRDSSRPASVMLRVHKIHSAIHKVARA